MNRFLIYAFLFFVGSSAGWCLELVFRRFCSNANPEKKWINPGFCVGPYLPIYGFGLCTMYALVSWKVWGGISSPLWRTVAILFTIAICMTLIEYVAGIFCLKVLKTRLWDYSDLWGNVQGIICPLFSAFWALGGAGYYFLVHPYILGALEWLSRNLAFSFVIGMFYGVFVIDVAYSANLMAKIHAFAARNDVVVKYEHLKSHIRSVQDRTKKKAYFFLPLHTQRPVGEWLKELYDEEHLAGKKLKFHVTDKRFPPKK